MRFKEYHSGSKATTFKCAAIAPNFGLVATGDDQNCLNVWGMNQNQPVSVSPMRGYFRF